MIEKIKNMLALYSKLELHILNIIKAQFFIQIVGGAFFLILNIFLAKNGFSDSKIAHFISFRFLAVMLLAFPLGFFIKGRALKPFLFLGNLGVPVIAILVVMAIKYKQEDILPFLFVSWGVSYTFFQVSVLPYIMRNTSEENQSHAIALSFATNSFGMILSGLLIFIFDNLTSLDNGQVLMLISLIGFFGLKYIFQINTDDITNKSRIKLTKFSSDLDWLLIAKAVIPTLIIAVGAGLTIPFINLFFFHNFYIEAADFALIGSCTSVLVAISSLFVPKIKSRFGYKKGITISQSIAVCALVILATTEFFTDYWFAFPVALLCYLLRAPLMNMAAPMTSQLTMNYVGKDNQEMLSAIMAAIWSGSWYFSSQIFRFLIDLGFPYSYIFYITAAFYSIGIFSYYLLILSYQRNNLN
ncbi:MAG: MFS transporter [Flavobacteriales bacterium]